MTVQSKVRIYDLAKELKLESKRLIEEVRREGVDVSVPSNTVSKELAEKIRNKYFPKKETVAPRAIRVVKKAHAPAPAETPHDETTEDIHTSVAPPPAAEQTPPPPAALSQNGAEASAPAVDQTVTAKPTIGRLVKKPLAPAERAEPPVQEPSAPANAATGTEASAPAESITGAPVSETPAPADAVGPVQLGAGEAQAAAPAVEQTGEAPLTPVATGASVLPPPPPVAPAPPSKQVKVLRLNASALNEGIKPGERVAAPPAPVVQPTPRERDRRGREAERNRNAPRATGTPGENANPQTVYTPPADARRPRPRAGARGRGGPAGGGDARGGFKGRGGRFDRDFVQPPKALTLEERIAGSLNVGANGGAVGTLKTARLVEGSTVKEFAEKLGIKPKDIVTLLLQRGVFATINQPLDNKVAVDLGERFGYEVTFVPFEEMQVEEEFEELIETGADDVEVTRAPVVTVMGHVDHGKTSLLDGIRATDVAAGEAGGITQHIGAYSVQVKNPDNPAEMRRVVFLDTPGHEAFTMMRARGAKATDVVVLVVAADDGVMPQTIEAIEHSRAAGVPIIVAINKIDRPDANPDRVRQELAGHGLQAVGWGGETEMVEVSAKQRKNLDTLLETVLLTTDILNLRASPTRRASGVVLEAKLDRGRGSVATVLVQQGTLRVHDPFIAGQVFGKVRAMFDDKGASITEAGPATPVEVLGLQGVPQAGESFQVVDDISRAQSISEHRQMVTRQNTLLQTTKRGIEALGEKEVKELRVVLKADVQGSVEVLKSTLTKLSTEAVKVFVVRSGVGAITESDVLLASATQAGASNSAVVIIGFNVRPEVRAAELAKLEHVDIRLHSIIYKVEEEIRAAMIGMLEAIESEKILGKAEVRQVFKVPRAGTVAGCMVIDGTIRRNARARLIRDGVVAWEGGIESLRRVKDDVSEVREGFECGISLENFNDVKVGDQIEAYIVEKVAATEL
ncbi:MAG TPA: translation initiation factor IF-2 [Pyrinomonadaceae bacterium]|jgi:translation initiation factor IF-2|nr:translation initiation factor IF-2 [Pyrinomonadaceae bacterium]